METIEVLRSDNAIRNAFAIAYNKDNTINEIEKEDIEKMKISTLFETAGVSNVDVKNLTEETASDEPLIGATDKNYTIIIEKNIPDIRQVYNNAFIKNIKNNKPLESNYVDSIRGNVIKSFAADCLYEEEFDYEDHMHIINGGKDYVLTNTHGQYKRLFLINDAIIKNKISNCFVGKDLSNGAALSFWVRGFSGNIKDVYDTGLLSFIGDYDKHYFDALSKENDSEYVKFTSSLSIDAQMCVKYCEAFYNTLEKLRSADYITENRNNDVRRALYRLIKSWAHIIVSFTNDDIVIYVNGNKVEDYYKITKGKRFGSNCDIDESIKECRTSILDFLSDEKTSLYLGATLNRNKTSSSMLYDDITFYNSSVNDEEAKTLFEDALKINLP